MTKYFVRVAAKEISGEEDYPMILDVLLDIGDEGAMMAGSSPRCGYFGNLGETLHPFVLRKEQSAVFPPMGYVMDFGTEYDGDYRHYLTNMPAKPLYVGATFTVIMRSVQTAQWEEYTYSIRRLTNLLTEQAIEIEKV